MTRLQKRKTTRNRVNDIVLKKLMKQRKTAKEAK